MICTVYWRKGGFILVPDCMRASRTVEQQYGPLRHCGSIDTANLPAGLREGIERDIDAELFSRLTPELATRLGYQAIEDLPLPAGFAWQEDDWWDADCEISLLCVEHEDPVVVATVAPRRQGGWVATTNRHRPWAFQGAWVCATRAAALQYVAVWAHDHADALRALIRRHAKTGGPTPPMRPPGLQPHG